MTSIVLFGDSMLGRFTKPRIDQLERQTGTGTVVFNCAAGGWTSADGARRAATIARLDPDVVVLSFGANDCTPDRLVELDAFTANVHTVTAAFPRARKIAFLPPSVVEVDGVGRGGRTNAVLDRYRGVLRDAVTEGDALKTDDVLAPLTAGGEPVHEDGLHLTGEAYQLVISVLAKLISGR